MKMTPKMRQTQKYEDQTPNPKNQDDHNGGGNPEINSPSLFDRRFTPSQGKGSSLDTKGSLSLRKFPYCKVALV